MTQDEIRDLTRDMLGPVMEDMDGTEYVDVDFDQAVRFALDVARRQREECIAKLNDMANRGPAINLPGVDHFSWKVACKSASIRLGLANSEPIDVSAQL